MSARDAAERRYRELLVELLPAVYRARDDRGQLARFLALFGHELDRLRANVEQLWRDQSIDACQDWVIPYLGDLVGTDVLHNDPVRARADVRDTVRWRRQKGTLAGLEDVAAGVTGWGAHAGEMLARLVWAHPLERRRPRAPHALRLADGAAVARVGTPFDGAARSVDLRSPGARNGWHHPRAVAFHLWPIPSHAWEGATPAAEDGRRYRFHPLGVDTPLHAGGTARPACDAAPADDRPDVCHPRADNLPIRPRDLADHPRQYVGQPSGFSVYEDGVLLCRTEGVGESRSQTTAGGFAPLAAARGVTVADAGLFAGLGAFRVSVRGLDLASVGGRRVTYSPARDFAGNLVLAGDAGSVDTGTLAFTAGGALAPEPDVPPALLLAVERMGATAAFPESEVVVRDARGAGLVVYLPALAGLAVAQPVHLYVADDGSTYFARALHDAGAPELNPDSSLFGALLPRHLARASAGQVMPRAGVRPVAFREPVQRRLCCWERPIVPALAAGEVAFDPARGRFAFPAGEEPAGELTVDFRFALTAEVGAGPFFREVADAPASTVTVAKHGAADFTTIQGAIDATLPVPGLPVVIEVLDGRTYDEALLVDGRSYPDGLVLRAAPLAVPVVRAPAGARALDVTATSDAASLVVDGLVLAGGEVVIVGDVPRVELRTCTLHPDSAPLVYDPPNDGARLALRRVIAGPVAAGPAVAEMECADAVVQHPAATPLHPSGAAALAAPAARLTLRRATVVGDVSAASLFASDAVLHGALAVADAAASCLRFSRCATVPDGAAAYRCTGAFPTFASLRYGDAAYARLHVTTAAAIVRGGEDGGEMGAFQRAGEPWRLGNLAARLDEYLPAGLRPATIRVLPRLPFAGATRP